MCRVTKGYHSPLLWVYRKVVDRTQKTARAVEPIRNRTRPQYTGGVYTNLCYSLALNTLSYWAYFTEQPYGRVTATGTGLPVIDAFKASLR